ncbi:DUF4142 domain-containing protein [Microvirga thermotolerans]|uniref:DUF4142 domain-containing protein n=1 Tax=Microvirga thermotolerans TaxID=2651334 RepID=A0A5P9JX77_9HYPH|nr:DUF4142 domain-containing protein [Microvirga thermotolerans]QFU16839.1 DUF4142 domain-containing protein [Microvirga thermotolerans]
MANMFAKAGLVALIALAPLGVSAKDDPGRQFIVKAIQGNMAEIAMGQLAQQKGASDGVKSFGQMLVQDHSAAKDQASAAATAAQVTPPTEPNKEQKATYDRMSKLSGAAFDRQFVAHMVADHKKEIGEYQKEAKRSDGAISDYAKATLPTLQKHLETAQSLERQVKAAR